MLKMFKNVFVVSPSQLEIIDVANNEQALKKMAAKKKYPQDAIFVKIAPISTCLTLKTDELEGSDILQEILIAATVQNIPFEKALQPFITLGKAEIVNKA